MDDMPKRILLRAAELIGQGWAKNAYARNSAGLACGVHCQDAASFCMHGALWKAQIELAAPAKDFDAALRRLTVVLKPRVAGLDAPHLWFNDHAARDAAEVVAVFREAAGAVGA